MPAVSIPDFPASLDWINSPPLSLKRELQGKIVVLDFWTYCCINCMHILPDLATLEQKYANQPVVFVGVHSPKFPNERETEHLRQAVLRYGVQHPVVNDHQMQLWKQLGVRSWPTLMVLGPHGQLILAVCGEGNREQLDKAIEQALDDFAEQLNDSVLPLKPEQPRPSSLLFPGKIASNDALYIADSGHDRVVITGFDGQIRDVIGSGNRGKQDGAFARASLCNPQGLLYLDKRLYIADTDNHALRVADLGRREVHTIIDGLNSPWDLALYGTMVLIAMAGSHQIWGYDLDTKQAGPLSGTGAEARLDGKRAAWAQPSGLAVNRNELYVADSESSSIRTLHLTRFGAVTLAGGDRHNPANLFAYGDREGIGYEARFQHPLAVAWWAERGRLVVADSYNHRLKLLDPQTQEVKNWIGDGQAGFVDGDPPFARFSEPSGLALHGDALFVADTNNHAIRHIDLKHSTTATVEIR